MMFENRKNAAILLLDKLKHYKGKNAIIAGIPRGAMPMAKILADGLQGELSAVLVHKIPSPSSEELAIGCVGVSGHIHLLSYVENYSISSSYIAAKAREQLKILNERRERYGLKIPDYKNRIVIIVDDGIATGATTMCAIHEVRSSSPQKIILATAVASSPTAEQLRPLVDEFIALYLPQNMYSIGQFYEKFPQVTDEEVVEMLHEKGGVHEYYGP
jgi:putative phosphoribosyl transferase